MERKKKLGEMLIEQGVLDEVRLRVGLKEQQKWGGFLGRLLVDMKLIDEDELVGALSKQLRVPAVDLDLIEVPRHVIDLVPTDLAEQSALVPFDQQGKFLDVAMADPSNLGVVAELQLLTQLNVRTHIAGPRAIERALLAYYGRSGAVPTTRARRSSTAPPPRAGAIDLAPSTGPRDELEIVRPPKDQRDLGAFAQRDAEIAALQRRVSQLEALVARDESVLRKLLGLLVEKGVASREEIVERLK
jgi:hypothetical protein